MRKIRTVLESSYILNFEGNHVNLRICMMKIDGLKLPRYDIEWQPKTSSTWDSTKSSYRSLRTCMKECKKMIEASSVMMFREKFLK